ncbi:class I SAM-dependent RNA methyltransferase [Candidatus Electronema sp. PJ]|uniref:class I SAM-dependent RNA methyltransferase n=1 Tax=Candidatus Electronema sp. PJ TaxID=3401572 RepID=UPI003AA8CD84
MQEVYSVHIEKIVAGGSGLARSAAGQVILSGLVLPGERVELRKVKQKSGFIEAELLQVLEPSVERVLSCCPLYGECGGCDLQHSSYAEQLRIKQAIVAEAMQRAHLLLPSAGVDDVLPSPVQWGCRHRLRLKINAVGQLGFFRKKSNAFVAVPECLAAAAGINAALVELTASKVLRGLTEEVELLQSPADGQITLVLPLKKPQQLSAAVMQMLTGVCSHIGCISDQGFRHLYSRNNGQTQKAALLRQAITLPKLAKRCVLSWSGGCFSQVNPGQNARLIALALELAGDVRGKSVLDLYCGMGNFSVPLALAGGEVFGVEGNGESIKWAKYNAQAAGVAARFVAADVHDSLRQMVKAQQQADIILLDPPRAGIGPAAPLLPGLHAEKIIYISCDPATLARDLRSLCGKGYVLRRLIPVDMFPQTHHIETVALLERS